MPTAITTRSAGISVPSLKRTAITRPSRRVSRSGLGLRADQEADAARSSDGCSSRPAVSSSWRSISQWA
jgi:hypothetical protein